MELRFHNGRFRVMLAGDPHANPADKTPREKNIWKDYLELQYAALEAAKPDLAVLMGDNANGTDLFSLEKSLFRIAKPYADRGVPFTFVLGNHDLQEDFTTLENVYGIYRSLPGCLLPEDRTAFGDFTLPVLSENGDAAALNLICMYSGGSVLKDKGSYYDWPYPGQIAWLKNTLKERAGTPAVLFQHIPLPEEFGLLNERTALSMAGRGVLGQNEQKGRFFTLKKGVEGYLGEAPCAPAVNAGEFEAIEASGDLFAAFFGHDHMNDFCGMYDGLVMGQCQSASFNVYGDGTRQGVRILDFTEAAPYTLETRMLRYRELISPKSRSVRGSVAVLHDRTSIKLHVLGGAAAAAAAIALPAALIGARRIK